MKGLSSSTSTGVDDAHAWLHLECGGYQLGAGILHLKQTLLEGWMAKHILALLQHQGIWVTFDQITSDAIRFQEIFESLPSGLECIDAQHHFRLLVEGVDFSFPLLPQLLGS